MTYENTAGLGVHNQYGARKTGGAVGKQDHDGLIAQVAVELTGEMLNGTFVPPVYVPKGALFTRAYLRVDEAFALTGTTPAVSFGASGSVGTNYISLSKTELEAIGTKPVTSVGNGTWAFASTTGTTAAAKIAFALTGTTPAVSSTIGKATLILEYVDAAKV